MSIILAAWAYLTEADSWTGANGILIERFNGDRELANDSIIALTIEHLAMTASAVGIAAAIALPLGLVLGHYGRGGTLTVVLTNVSRAIPTLALLMLFAASAIGFGNRAVVIAVAIFALPPILTNAYVGMRGVDEAVKDAARGQGMSRAQQALRVELPLAVPLIAAGMRTARRARRRRRPRRHHQPRHRHPALRRSPRRRRAGRAAEHRCRRARRLGPARRHASQFAARGNDSTA